MLSLVQKEFFKTVVFCIFDNTCTNDTSVNWPEVWWTQFMVTKSQSELTAHRFVCWRNALWLSVIKAMLILSVISLLCGEKFTMQHENDAKLIKTMSKHKYIRMQTQLSRFKFYSSCWIAPLLQNCSPCPPVLFFYQIFTNYDRTRQNHGNRQFWLSSTKVEPIGRRLLDPKKGYSWKCSLFSKRNSSKRWFFYFW